MGILDTLEVVLGMDIDGFAEGIIGAHKHMRNFEDMVEEVANTVTDLAKDAIEAGFDMVNSFQRAEIAISAMTDSAAESATMLQQIKDFAISTPFKFDEVLTAAQRLHGFGIEAADIIPMMTVLGDKIASINGSSDVFSRIAKDMGEIAAQGYLSKRIMNSMVNNGIAPAAIMMNALGVSEGKLYDMVAKKQVTAKMALSALLNNFLASNGAMMRMTATLAGAWDQATERVGMFMGEALLPLAEHLTMMIPDLATLADSFSSFVEPTVTAVIALVDWLDHMLKVFNALPSSYKEATAAAVLFAAGLFLAFTAGMGLFFALSATLSALMAIGAVIYALGLPAFIAIIAAMAMLGAALGILFTAFTILVDAWRKDWFQIREVTAKVVSFMADLFDGLMKVVDTVTTTMMTNFLTTLQTITIALFKLATAIQATGKAPAWVDDTVNSLVGLIATFEDMKNSFKINGFLGNMASGAGVVKDLVAKGLVDMLTETKDRFTFFINGPLKDLFESMLPADAKKVFDDWMAGKEDALSSTSADMKAKLKDWIESFIAKLPGADGGGGKAGKDPFYESLKNFAKVFASALEPVKHAADGMVDGLNHMQDAMQDWIDGMKAKSDAIKYGVGFLSGGKSKSGLDAPGLVGGANDFSQNLAEWAPKLEAMGGMLGKIGALMSKLVAMGPIVTGGIGILITLVTKTKTFADIIDELNGVIDHVVDMINVLIRPLQKLFNVLFAIVLDLIQIGFLTSGTAEYLQQIFNLLGYVGAVLVPIMTSLDEFVRVLQNMVSSQRVANQAMSGTGHALFEVSKALASVLTIFTWAIGTVWDAMVNAILDVIAIFQKIPGFSKIEDKLFKTLTDTLTHPGNLTDSLSDLWNMTWQDANATAQHTTSVEDATTAMHQMTAELLNVPEGYKIALARFNAATGSSPRNSSAGGSTGGSGGSTSTTGTGKHGGDDNGDTVQIKHQTTKPTSRSRKGGISSGDVYIDTVVVQANDLGQLYDELAKVGIRKSVVSTGRVNTKGSVKFSSR